MGVSTGHVMTLANSIIGVSVLAMPFCFKQCGIVLSVLLLVISGAMTRLCCHFLIKSAGLARRRNYEFLAFHTFGPTGKLVVELSIIGFLLGTCIAFFVVMGDLGPDIIAKALSIPQSSSLRPSVLIGLAVFVVLPLGLLRNVDSLSSVCTASILFYICLVLKVVSEATPHLLAADWLDHVYLWRPAGILQCIPIFSMALACQTQVFEIYESLPDASQSRMNEVVRSAVNMCTGVYISVGFFGYVAFCTQNFSGNILLSFSPSMLTDVMKLGFVLSVAVSFPLAIFPCRASLYSLLFRRVSHVSSRHAELAGGPTHIPEARFKCLTLFLVLASLVVGILLPNIELVLGLVGSTIGTVICLLLPALMFARLSSRHTSERLMAQIIFFSAAAILILSTYANLYAADKASSGEINVVSLRPPELMMRQNLVEESAVVLGKGVIGGALENVKNMDKPGQAENIEVKNKKTKLVEALKKVEDLEKARREKAADSRNLPVADPPKKMIPPLELPRKENPPPEVVKKDALLEEPPKQDSVEGDDKKQAEKPIDEVNQDAIKKEDEERVVEEGPKVVADAVAPTEVPAPAAVADQELLDRLAQHEAKQKDLLEEQKLILHELKQRQKEMGKEEALKEDKHTVLKDRDPKVSLYQADLGQLIKENAVKQQDLNQNDVLKNKDIAESIPVLPAKEKPQITNNEVFQPVQPVYKEAAKPVDGVAKAASEIKVENKPDNNADIGQLVSGLQKLTKDLKESLEVMKQQAEVKPEVKLENSPVLNKTIEIIKPLPVAQPEEINPPMKVVTKKEEVKKNKVEVKGVADLIYKPRPQELGALLKATKELLEKENVVEPALEVKQAVEERREKRDAEESPLLKSSSLLSAPQADLIPADAAMLSPALAGLAPAKSVDLGDASSLLQGKPMSHDLQEECSKP